MDKKQILKVLTNKLTFILDYNDETHNVIKLEDFNDIADAILILNKVIRQSEQLSECVHPFEMVSGYKVGFHKCQKCKKYL